MRRRRRRVSSSWELILYTWRRGILRWATKRNYSKDTHYGPSRHHHSDIDMCCYQRELNIHPDDVLQTLLFFKRVWSPSVIPVSFLICILQGQQLKQVYKQTTVTEGAKCNCCTIYIVNVKSNGFITRAHGQFKRALNSSFRFCDVNPDGRISFRLLYIRTHSWWTFRLDSFFFWYAGQIKRRRCHQMLSSICIYSHYIPRCWDFMAKVYNLFRRNFTCAIWSGTLNLNLVGHKKTSRAESWIHSSMTENHIIKKKQRASV